MTYNITLTDNHGVSVNMSKEDIATIFGGRSFDGFQTQLIRIVNEQQMHARVTNSRGNEIFAMRYSPSCAEGVCCMWQSTSRLTRFIKSFVA